MKYAFQKMRLEADSLYALINNWVETHLTVTEGAAVIIGYGYEIAGAFSNLVLDWEATVLLPRAGLELENGEYDLIMLGEELYACRKQQKYLLPDLAVTVEVVSVPEE
ncbi:MAG: hypothetical protein H6557_27380 [Lewinellaceae bacterium]|nr:hypothetical protein [Lewinellaceae bacterium]